MAIRINYISLSSFHTDFHIDNSKKRFASILYLKFKRQMWRAIQMLVDWSAAGLLHFFLLTLNECFIIPLGGRALSIQALASASVRHCERSLHISPVIYRTRPIWRNQITVTMLLSGQVANKTIPSRPSCLAHLCAAVDIDASAYMDPLKIALLFCCFLIGFKLVISATQSEHNDSFNGNSEKQCAQSGCVVRSMRDKDLVRYGICLLLPAVSLKSPICARRLSSQVGAFTK